MSLFLVMKKYDMSLAEYLEKFKDQITPRTSLILFTQLLEGIGTISFKGMYLTAEFKVFLTSPQTELPTEISSATIFFFLYLEDLNSLNLSSLTLAVVQLTVVMDYSSLTEHGILIEVVMHHLWLQKLQQPDLDLLVP